MSDARVKDIRKQLRTVAKELLPEVLSPLLKEAMFKELQTLAEARLNNIEGLVLQALQKIDKRSSEALDDFLKRHPAKVDTLISE